MKSHPKHSSDSDLKRSSAQENKPGAKASQAFADQRPNFIAQRKLRHGMAGHPYDENTAQLRSAMESDGQRSGNPIQRAAKQNGLPQQLKSGIEGLSGYSMDDVKVHYNSSKPAQLQAHAYAQGSNIHLAPGQEKHLPHEAWHVVQQKQGRVKATRQLKGKVAINDDSGLEREADVMGAKAIAYRGELGPVQRVSAASGNIAQRLAIGDRPFADGYEAIFNDPEWEQKTKEFEQRLGVYAYNSPRAQAAASGALNRLKDVIVNYYQGDAEEEEILREAFLRDNADSAGQIGTQATTQELQAIFNGGNLREQMTAFYNGAYYETGDSGNLRRSFKRILHDITLGNNQQAAHDLGLDEEALRQQREFLNRNSRWAVEKGLNVLKPSIAHTFAKDIFALGNLTYQEEGISASYEMGNSQKGRTTRPEADRRERQKDPDFYDNMGVPLSGREKQFQRRNAAGGPPDKLSWLEGETRYQMAPDSGFIKNVRRRMGMPVVAGISGTTTRMLSAFKWLNTTVDILDFRAAIIGWMLPHRDHSLYEILRGSHMAGVRGGEDIDDIVKMYSSVPPFTEAEIRTHVAENGMLPHELIYKKKAGYNGGFKETADKHKPNRPFGPLERGTWRTADIQWRALEHAQNHPGFHLNPTLARAGTTAAEVRSSITEAHAIAIATYTGGSHYFMNAALKVQSYTNYFPGGSTPQEMSTNFGSRKAIEGLLSDLVKYFSRRKYLRDKPDKTDIETQELRKLEEAEMDWPASLEPFRQEIFRDIPALDISEEEREARRKALDPRIATLAEELVAEIKAHVNMTVEGLSKLPSVDGIDVWRGDWDTTMIGLKYFKNKIVVTELTSTSRDREVAEGFANGYTGGNASKGVLLQLTLTGNGGKDISYLSEKPDEDEILLMPGTQFRIDERGQEGNYTLIKATEI